MSGAGVATSPLLGRREVTFEVEVVAFVFVIVFPVPRAVVVVAAAPIIALSVVNGGGFDDWRLQEVDVLFIPCNAAIGSMEKEEPCEIGTGAGTAI
jgi:hypothetical protein